MARVRTVTFIQVFVLFREKSETETLVDLPYGEITALEEKNTLYLGADYTDTLDFGSMRELYLIPLSVYNRKTGRNITLGEGEAIAFSSDGREMGETLELLAGKQRKSYRLLDTGEEDLFVDYYMGSLIPQISLVIPDLNAATGAFEEVQEKDGRFFSYIWKYSFDLKKSPLNGPDYAKALKDAIIGVLENDLGITENYTVYFDDRETERQEYMALNGSLFFIGIVLSVVMILAAVLIIYYKQISEGYEDCRRFEVMRKVGMSGKEIRKNINSQLLVVFFIPLVFAGLHLVFAFPMIRKLLNLFGLLNQGLFVATTLISFAVFAVFYTIVYKLTSNAYYNIVSDAG